jgi:hypothetical protein
MGWASKSHSIGKEYRNAQFGELEARKVVYAGQEIFEIAFGFRRLEHYTD